MVSAGTAGGGGGARGGGRDEHAKGVRFAGGGSRLTALLRGFLGGLKSDYEGRFQQRGW